MKTLATIEAEADSRGRTAASLRATLDGDRLGHAYLFHGPTGAGKAETAWAFAAARMCTESSDGSCGACRACTLVFADGHPDLHSIEPENGRTIGVDQIRKLLDALTLAPLEGPGRMALIEPACSMPEAAANALLKTLEEPPRGVLLVLLTPRPDLLLPTIRSRCVQLRFSPRALAVEDAPEGSYGHSIAEAAKALLDRRGDAFERAERCYALIERAAGDDESGATLTERRRRAALVALDAVTARLRGHLRDLATSGRGLQRLSAAVEQILDAGRHLESNAIPLLVLEVLALDLDVAAGRRAAPKPLYFGRGNRVSEGYGYRVLVRYGEWAAIGDLATREADLAPGEEVVVRTERGREWGVVLEAPATGSADADADAEAGRVLRRASEADRVLRAAQVDALAEDYGFLVGVCRQNGIGFLQIAVERPLGGERIVFYLELAVGASLDTGQWKVLGEALTERYGEQRVELREVGEEVRLAEVGCGSGGGCTSCGKGDQPRKAEPPVIHGVAPTPLPMLR